MVRAPQPPVLGWDDVAALDREGTLRFEAHTVTHPNLLAVDDARGARGDRGGSARARERPSAGAVTAFAYPAGLYGERERRLVAEAGYAAAVTCEPGVNLPVHGPPGAAPAPDRRARLACSTSARRSAAAHDTPLPLRGAYRRLRYGAGARMPRRASSRA